MGFFLLFIPIKLAVLLFTIAVHEYSHGLAARVLGDDTAEKAGRVTLNPFSHVDAAGAAMLYFLHIGWAKPVPINPENFKNPKRDTCLVALAGPLSNIALALVLALLYHVLPIHHTKSLFGIVKLSLNGPGAGLFTGIFSLMLQNAIMLNIGLALFNLIPLPPLDGSKIAGGFLPDSLYEVYVLKGEAWGAVLFAGVMIASFFWGNIIGKVISGPLEFMTNLLI